MTQNPIFEQAMKSVMDRNKEQGVEIAQKALEQGIDPMEMMEKGFVPGIGQVGDLFGKGKVFLPELMMAADVMKAVTDILNAALPTGAEQNKGKVLIATVNGDVHDIGKGIVISMLRANGFEVLDLGRDVPTEKIMAEATDNKVDIIGTSALLTTTMPKQKELEEALKEAGLKGSIRTIVGGAPVTPRWAKRIGADAYAEDAQDAVVQVKALLAG